MGAFAFSREQSNPFLLLVSSPQPPHCACPPPPPPPRLPRPDPVASPISSGCFPFSPPRVWRVAHVFLLVCRYLSGTPSTSNACKGMTSNGQLRGNFSDEWEFLGLAAQRCPSYQLPTHQTCLPAHPTYMARPESIPPGHAVRCAAFNAETLRRPRIMWPSSIPDLRIDDHGRARGRLSKRGNGEKQCFST